jgi:hypothetical protein
VITSAELERMRDELRDEARKNDQPVDYTPFMSQNPADRTVRIFGCGFRSVVGQFGDTWVSKDGKWGFYPKVKNV